MYQEYWGLTARPFPSRVGPADFFESPTHEEALARLQFLVEQQHRVGLLFGSRGSGKTLLLNTFARSLRRTGRRVVLLSLLGQDEPQFLDQLATQLDVGLPRTANQATLWRSILDRILANHYQRQATIILLDDADEGSPGILSQIARLAECDNTPEARLTIILAANREHPQRLGDRLLELSELRIEIEPWAPEDTREFLTYALSRAGSERSVFGPTAVERLHQLAHGVPRRICQLAELALLAGAGEQRNEVDGETVDAAFAELAVLAN